MDTNKIVYLDQVVGPISIDIINYFSTKYVNVELVYGNIQSASTEINSEVKRKRLFRYIRTSTSKRIFSWLVFFIQSIFLFSFKKKDFSLFVVSNPPLNIFLCFFLNKFWKVPYYILVFDMYPEAFIRYGYLNNSNKIVSCWYRLNRMSYQKAEKIFTLTAVMSENIRANGGAPIVIDMWANTENIRPIKKRNNKFLISNNLTDSFIVLYSGNFGETHDIEVIINAALELKNIKQIKFVFIGDGFKRKYIKDSIKEKELTNTLIFPFQESEIFPYSIASADVSIVTLEDKASDISIPSKLFYNMAAGNAIISVSHIKSELAKIVTENDIGINLTSESKSELSEWIVYLFNNKKKLDKFSENSRRASERYDLKNVEKFDLD